MKPSAGIYQQPSLSVTRLPVEQEIPMTAAVDPVTATHIARDKEKAKNILLALRLQLSTRPD